MPISRLASTLPIAVALAAGPLSADCLIEDGADGEKSQYFYAAGDAGRFRSPWLSWTSSRSRSHGL